MGEGKGAKRLGLKILEHKDPRLNFDEPRLQRRAGQEYLHKFVEDAKFVRSCIEAAAARTQDVRYRKDAIYELSGLMRDCRKTWESAGQTVSSTNLGEFHTLIRKMITIAIAADLDAGIGASEAAKLRQKCVAEATADKAYNRSIRNRERLAEASEEAES